jgi:hypothetical protein
LKINGILGFAKKNILKSRQEGLSNSYKNEFYAKNDSFDQSDYLYPF